MSSQLALVVEDNKDEATIFARALENAGFETEIIRSGDAALARLAVVVPDLVVLDLRLPYIPGTDVLRRIRSDGRLAETHVIVVTGDPQMAENLAGEVDLVLIKPISFSQLRGLAAHFTDATSPSE